MINSATGVNTIHERVFGQNNKLKFVFVTTASLMGRMYVKRNGSTADYAGLPTDDDENFDRWSKELTEYVFLATDLNQKLEFYLDYDYNNTQTYSDER